MASTTVPGKPMSVSSPPAVATAGSPGTVGDVAAMGSSSDLQSEDVEDQSRGEQLIIQEYDDIDDPRPRNSPTRRRLDDSEMDSSQTAKKRRKQYKPVRIALPVASNFSKEPKKLPTVYVSSGHGIMGPDDEGYEGEEDGECGIKFDDIKEGRLNAEPNVLSSGSSLQGIENTENSVEYKCLDCMKIFLSSEAISEHKRIVHQQKLQQNMYSKNASSNGAANASTFDKPLDLAQSQVSAPDPQSDCHGISSSSGNYRASSVNPHSDSLPIPATSPSSIPVVPFHINPFSDGKILIPKLLGIAPPFILPHIPEKSSSAMSSQVQSSVTTGNADSNSSTIRIFNPEAYCELCNKEFCNKYFLKTHKANKHGIYTDTQNLSAGSTITGVSFNNSFTNAVPTTGPPRSITSSASFNTQKTQTEMNSLPKSNTGIPMKVNCEVCHRKFSNRLVVMRHKAKVHGLVEGNLVGADLANKIGVDFWPRFEREEHGNTSTSSETGSITLENQTNENNTASQTDFIGDSHPISREKLNTSPHVSMSKSSPSMSFKLSPSNSFSEFNVDQEDTKQQFQQDFPAISVESETANSSGQSSVPPNSWSSYQVSPSTSTAKVSNLSHDRLRKLGVINADAFCEICCKEYCNKYFLRTHKLKRHGIVTPEFETKGPGRTAWNQVQTSPLNLIVGEQSTSNWNSVDTNTVVERLNNDIPKREGSNGTSGTQTDQPETEKLECNVCGRHFQSQYLMQMHKIYMHPPPSVEGTTDEVNLSESSNQQASSLRSTARENQSPNNNQVSSIPSENSQPSESSATNQNDFASGNLQKIQTMIMLLNKSHESKVNFCNICNKEVEDKLILRSHMVAEHGIMLDSDKDMRSDGNSPDSHGQQYYPSAYCSICKKDFFAKCFLKKHLTDYHGNVLPKVMKEELKETSERNSIVEKRVSVTPTSSYCEICNKELCNKYFMKTHMQRMHGIEIENGSQIGGVICDICNKELCSKYFLRVHKQNTHGIVEDPVILQHGKDSSYHGTPPESGMNSILQESNDHSLKPVDVGDLTHRYFTHFTEVCPICNRRFRSTKWLKAHLMNDHSEMGIEKWKEIELQYQLQLHQPRQKMAKGHPIISHCSKSSSSFENGTEASITPTWTTNIGTQSEPSLRYPEAMGSAGMKQYSNEEDISTHENLAQAVTNYTCSQMKKQKNSEMSSGDGGNGAEKSQCSQSVFNAGELKAEKNYHCSFCPFKTPVLAYLFVHEKTHTGHVSPPPTGTKKQFECPICHLTFVHSDIFNRHLISHQYTGIIGSITTGVPMQQIHSQSSRNAQNPPSDHQEENDANTGDDYPNMREPIVEVVIDERGEVLDSEDYCANKCFKCMKSFKSEELLLTHAQKESNCLYKAKSSPVREVTPSPKTNELTITSPRFMTPSSDLRPQEKETFKCMQCSYTTEEIAHLKNHIMKEHPEDLAGCPPKNVPGGELLLDVPFDSGEMDSLTEFRRHLDVPSNFDSGETDTLTELRLRLDEVAKSSHVPASYAVPQRIRLTDDDLGRSSFVMQPFLLKEPEETRRSPGDGTCFQTQSINGKFVPSLVFLPVREKLSKPLTVSFSLTPA